MSLLRIVLTFTQLRFNIIVIIYFNMMEPFGRKDVEGIHSKACANKDDLTLLMSGGLR